MHLICVLYLHNWDIEQIQQHYFGHFGHLKGTANDQDLKYIEVL